MASLHQKPLSGREKSDDHGGLRRGILRALDRICVHTGRASRAPGPQGRGLRARRRHGQAYGVPPGTVPSSWRFPSLSGFSRGARASFPGLALYSPWSGLLGSCVLGWRSAWPSSCPPRGSGRPFLSDLYRGRSENLQFFRGRVDAKMLLYLVAPPCWP